LRCPAKIWRFTQVKNVIFAHGLLFIFLAGCSTSLSSPEDVTKFEKAGPIQTVMDFDQSAKGKPGPYRVIPGDVLEFQMHVSLRIVSSELPDWLRPSYGYKEIEPYIVRVSDAGTVTLPIIGDIQIAGKTLAEIEQTVKNAYYPKYVVNPPMLVCQVKNYQGEHERIFTVMGLVNKPDAYPYPQGVQYNLMEALAFAGGLDMVADPQYVKVFRQDTDGKVLQVTFRIGGKALKEAYAIAIKPGDVIYVDHTISTRINKFLADVFHITVGANVNAAEFN
jgi:protein involved in polysaccharide export with SLBB domain